MKRCQRQRGKPKPIGQSTTGITLDTYSHVMPDMQDEAAQRLDAVLKAAAQKLEAGVS
jgi:hypothetical protein